MNKIIKIVFSGGPNVGKSSILQELKIRGYDVRNEVFTKLFSEAQKENRFEGLFKNKNSLINKLIELQIKEEKIDNINTQKYIFLDRGMVDIIGFSKEIEYKLTMEEISILEKFHYDLCFIPEPLDKQFYDKNSIRRQTFEESLERQEQCIDVYREFYKKRNLDPEKYIIFVPNFLNHGNLSVIKRADFVLKAIEDKKF